jgi:uncharacterized protein (TIGR03435 family)
MHWQVASVAILAGAGLFAQPASPKFEWANIQPGREPEAGSRYFTDRDRLVLQNQSLKDCIRIAFDVKAVRVAPGGPKWVEAQHFDIEAKAASVAGDHEMKAMLRALLLERFKLEVHRETKMSPGYSLVVAKGGLKIRAVPPGPSRISSRRASLNGECASMASLAQALSDAMNRPVIDLTAVPGVFTFQLEWTPDVVQPGSLTADDEDPNVLPDMPRGPSISAALQDQLGLKLETRKVPLDVLLIDRAERPSER